MPDAQVLIVDPSNGGLSVARSLVRRGVRVAVIAGDANSYTVRIRGVEGHAIPFADSGRAWIDKMAQLAGQGTWAAVTGSDVVTEWLAEERDRIPAAIRTFEAQDDAHLPLISKDSSEAIALAAGVAVPWTRRVLTLEALDDAIAHAPWPCVLKPVLSHDWRAVFGDDRVLLVHDAVEARREAERALGAGLPMMLSEYIPGGDDAVEEAIVVRAADGSYPVEFGCQKIRQYPVGFGAASLCEIAELPETMTLAKAVLDEAGYVGVAGVETKRHAENGRRYFLEVNVRITTQFGLGDASGLDSSWRMVASLLGETLGPQPPQQRRARLVYPQQEVRAALAALRAAPPDQRLATARSLARSYAGTRDVGVFDPRDPMPGLALAGGALGRRVQRRFGRR
jgi:predicted ATP-grasp superfamily ATP-dependent carboligase